MGARDDLLERVMTQVAEGGFIDRSLRDVAAGAGTSHRMLIHHFGDRAGLTAAIAHAVERDQRAALMLLAGEASSPFDLMRRTWSAVTDESVLPFVRLFFEVAALAAQGRAGTEQFAADLVEPWLQIAVEAAATVGSEVDRDVLRAGVALQRGLLLDALATDDVDGATRAHEAYVRMWETASAA